MVVGMVHFISKIGMDVCWLFVNAVAGGSRNIELSQHLQGAFNHAPRFERTAKHPAYPTALFALVVCVV
jgi:hypothetical protein